MMEKRLQYIDSAKGIIIFYMLLGHVGGINLGLSQWIFSFHMPFFFFVYGFQLDDSKLKNWGGVRRKIKEYLVPYFIWALIYMRKFSYVSYGSILYGTKESIRTASQGYLWFLPCMFLAVMFYRLLMSKVNKLEQLIIIAIGCSIIAGVTDYTPALEKGLPWGINIAIGGVGLMIFGRMYRLMIERYGTSKCFIVIISILCAGLAFTYKLNSGSINGLWHLVSMANAAYGNYILYLLTAITQSILHINVCMFIDNRVLRFIGRNTMAIYMLHGILFALYVEIITVDIVNANLRGFVISFITLVISLLFAQIINKYCPWLVGKSE